MSNPRRSELVSQIIDFSNLLITYLPNLGAALVANINILTIIDKVDHMMKFSTTN